MHKIFIFILFASVIGLRLNAQTVDSSATLVKPDSTTKVNNGKQISLDSLPPKKENIKAVPAKKDSVVIIEKKHHDPHKATIRSAIIPGWGQAYNREYWKIPIVYGALSIPASLFVYNNNWYQRTKQAYDILLNGGDTAAIYPRLKGISAENLQFYRNSFRKDRDYSVLFFLLAWGLNVVDATVFGNLKEFDVSEDLSMHVQPDYDPVTKAPSLSVALNFKDKQSKILPSSF